MNHIDLLNKLENHQDWLETMLTGNIFLSTSSGGDILETVNIVGMNANLNMLGANSNIFIRGNSVLTQSASGIAIGAGVDTGSSVPKSFENKDFSTTNKNAQFIGKYSDYRWGIGATGTSPVSSKKIRIDTVDSNNIFTNTNHGIDFYIGNTSFIRGSTSVIGLHAFDNSSLQVSSTNFYFNLAGNQIATIDSNGNAMFDGVVTATEIDSLTDGVALNLNWGTSTSGTGVHIGNGAGGYGSLVAGSKSAITSTPTYGEVISYCDESPNHVFIDRGSGVIDNNGQCIVYIDPIFLETVTTKNSDYWVHLTGFKGCNPEIVELFPDHFVVSGNPNMEFIWKIEAERKGYERLRWNDANIYI